MEFTKDKDNIERSSNTIDIGYVTNYVRLDTCQNVRIVIGSRSPLL